jgi:Sugar phosphate isomerases/epimerases
VDKINIQLYSFGGDSSMTLQEKIKCAGELGFTGVEFAGGYDDIPVEDLKKVLDDAGVEAVSAHVGTDAMEKDIPYLAKLGVTRVICPMASFNTAEEAKELADDLNRLGKFGAQYGIKTGYHNHTNEYYKVDGKYLFDHLIENCDPEYVEFEIDCGWASAADVDPVEYINSHKGKICAIHIKENGDVIGAEKPSSRYDKSPFADLEFDEDGKPIFPEELLKMWEAHNKLNVAQGTGIVDWKAVKDAADAQMDNVLYVVEREANYGDNDRITCLKEDIKWLKENL